MEAGLRLDRESHPKAAGSAPLSGPDPASPLDLVLCRRLGLLSSHLVVALVALVVIGGATRVMEAGLACPDWPLCYGALLPGRQMNLQVFLEWFHRLDAFVVGLALLVMAAVTRWRRRQLPAGVVPLALLALALVAVQGLLGALTVTQLLAAPVVTSHFVTALLLVGLLSALHQRLEWVRALASDERPTAGVVRPCLPPLAAMVGLLLLAQCLLGAAMASQWAADLCISEGSGCQWLLWHRQLASAAAGALLVLAALTPQRSWGLALALGAGAQVALGLFTLRLQLSVPVVTVVHQLLAALLVAQVAALFTRSLAARHG